MVRELHLNLKRHKYRYSLYGNVFISGMIVASQVEKVQNTLFKPHHKQTIKK